MKKLNIFATRMFECANLADSLDKLTGIGYENSTMKLNRFDGPQVIDGFGNMDIKVFRDVAKSSTGLHLSDLDICNEVSKVTGRSYENLYYDMKKIDIKPLK